MDNKRVKIKSREPLNTKKPSRPITPRSKAKMPMSGQIPMHVIGAAEDQKFNQITPISFVENSPPLPQTALIAQAKRKNQIKRKRSALIASEEFLNMEDDPLRLDIEEPMDIVDSPSPEPELYTFVEQCLYVLGTRKSKNFKN
eukprot:GDKJ01059944.1.p1 GENE.GDKJ01059944.1~~GDKJ01059944.1.p1  ORF type:complete len:143 (-),score=20.41 GDKJ01059944.1:104-532(-)